jgi:hypothetical protein
VRSRLVTPIQTRAFLRYKTPLDHAIQDDGKGTAMPRKTRELSRPRLEKAVRETRAKPEGYKIAKGGQIAAAGVDGLYLRVAPGGSLNWILFYPKGTRSNGKGEIVRHRVHSPLYGVRGNYPTIGLKRACERVGRIRSGPGLSPGIAPARETRAARSRRNLQRLFPPDA